MTDHRIAARKALGYIPAAYDDARSTALASEATAHALLAIEARLGELVEQQKLANTIAAFGTDGEDGLIDIVDQAAAETYVRARVGRIVNPARNGDT
ncbi:hypothetical protein [Nocardia sp. SC052]|uniref:hypothetical protein n=1 Tax=Nocardia sichangensis TaxID=3385975 RepID=UPI0039A10812